MATETKTIKIGTGLTDNDSEFRHTESEGQWYIESVRVYSNGTGDGVNPRFDYGILPQGKGIPTVDDDDIFIRNRSAENDSGFTWYERFSIDNYVDFSSEEVVFNISNSDNGDYDAYLHIRRVA